jgi:hypothetical protein
MELIEMSKATKVNNFICGRRLPLLSNFHMIGGA